MPAIHHKNWAGLYLYSLSCALPALQAAPKIQPLPSAVLQQNATGQDEFKPAPIPQDSAIIEQRSIFAPPASKTAQEPQPAPASVSQPAQTAPLATDSYATPTPARALRSGTPRSAPEKQKPEENREEKARQTLAQAQQAFASEDYALVIALLAPYETALFKQRDQGAARLLGWAAFHRAEWPLARLWFTRAANWSNQSEDIANIARVELASAQLAQAAKRLAQLPTHEHEWNALRAQLLSAQALEAFNAKDYAQASRLLEAAAALHAPDAGTLEMAGWSAYHQGQMQPAAAFFAASYRQHPSEGAAQGLVLSHHATGDLTALYRLQDTLGTTQDQPLNALLANAEARRRVLESAEGTVPRVTLDQNLRLVPRIHTPEPHPAQARMQFFTGSNDISTQPDARFRQHGVVLEGDMPGQRDHVLLRTRLFNADDGQQSQNALRDLYARWRHEDQDGLETTLALGISPAGGQIAPGWIGEIGVGRFEANWGGRISLLRDNVEQSILSMSGAKADTPSGELIWGQVMRTGLNLSGYHAWDVWKGEGSLRLAELRGHGVADNRMAEIYANLLRPLETHWSAGPELYTTAYAYNLSQFTPGHGGYYSPEYLLRLGGLIRYARDWHEQGAGWHTRFQAGLGWQQAHEAAASLNPLTGEGANDYAANTSRGLAGHLELELGYITQSRWRFGLLLVAQESPSYSLFKGLLYVGYRWQ